MRPYVEDGDLLAPAADGEPSFGHLLCGFAHVVSRLNDDLGQRRRQHCVPWFEGYVDVLGMKLVGGNDKRVARFPLVSQSLNKSQHAQHVR